MVDLLVTYMEMIAPPAKAPLEPAIGFSISRNQLGVDGYLALYRAIGGTLQWDARLRMSRADLTAFLAADSTLICVLNDSRDVATAGRSSPAGLCEFDCAAFPEIELTNFGIVPAVYGQSLGPALLDAALRAAWSQSPRRVWLHTDTNDHPKAVATYERAGFRPYRRQIETFPD